MIPHVHGDVIPTTTSPEKTVKVPNSSVTMPWDTDNALKWIWWSVLDIDMICWYHCN